MPGADCIARTRPGMAASSAYGQLLETQKTMHAISVGKSTFVTIPKSNREPPQKVDEYGTQE